MNDWKENKTQIKEMAVDITYTFNPANITQIELRGDSFLEARTGIDYAKAVVWETPTQINAVGTTNDVRVLGEWVMVGHRVVSTHENSPDFRARVVTVGAVATNPAGRWCTVTKVPDDEVADNHWSHHDEWDMRKITIPVNRLLDTVKLTLAPGPHAVFDRIAFFTMHEGNHVELNTLQRIHTSVDTFLGREKESYPLSLNGLRVEPQNPPSALRRWEFTHANGWETLGVTDGTSRDTDLWVPVDYDGGEYDVEVDVEWDVAFTRSTSPQAVFSVFGMKAESDMSADLGTPRFQYSFTGNSTREIRAIGGMTVRIPMTPRHLAIGGFDTTPGRYHVILRSNSRSLSSTNRAIYRLKAARLVSSAMNVLTSGMSGEVLLKADHDIKLCQFEMMCNENARARFERIEFFGELTESPLITLLNDNSPENQAAWGREVVSGDVAYQIWHRQIARNDRRYVRAAKLYFNDGAEYVTDEVASTRSLEWLSSVVRVGVPIDESQPLGPENTQERRRVVGRGLLVALRFFKEAELDEFDTPVRVKFAIEMEPTSYNLDRNSQRGVYFYNEGEDEHLVSVHDLHFRPHEFEHLQREPKLRTTIQLSTDRGTIIGNIGGEVDTVCLAQKTPNIP